MRLNFKPRLLDSFYACLLFSITRFLFPFPQEILKQRLEKVQKSVDAGAGQRMKFLLKLRRKCSLEKCKCT